MAERNIQLTPSQIQSQGPQGRLESVDMTGGYVPQPSLWGDLAQGIQQLMPGMQAYAGKKQQEFVDKAIKQGAAEQVKDPLKTPVAAEGENPYIQDGRKVIWSKAVTADVLNKRQAKFDEILQSNDEQRIANAEKELEDFDRQNLAGIEQVDPELATEMFLPLVQQRNASNTMLARKRYEMKLTKDTQDLNAAVSLAAQDPESAAKALDLAIGAGLNAGIPRSTGYTVLAAAAIAELGRGNSSLLEMIVGKPKLDAEGKPVLGKDGRVVYEEPRDPVTNEPLSVGFARYGQTDKLMGLRHALDQHRSNIAKDANAMRKKVSEDYFNRFKQARDAHVNAGGTISYEEVNEHQKQINQAYASGILTQDDWVKLTDLNQSTPQRLAQAAGASAEMSALEGIYNQVQGQNAARPPSEQQNVWSQIQSQLNLGQVSEKTVREFMDQRHKAAMEIILAEQDPVKRGEVMQAAIKDIANQTPLSRVWKNPLMEDLFGSLKTGNLIGTDGKPMKGKEVQYELFKQILLSPQATTIINAHVEDNTSQQILQSMSQAARVFGGNPDLEKTAVAAQKAMTDPLEARHIIRATSDLSDEAFKELAAKNLNTDTFGQDKLSEQNDKSILGDPNLSPQSLQLMRARFNTFRRDYLLTPGNRHATDEDVARAFLVKQSQEIVWGENKDFFVIDKDVQQAATSQFTKMGMQAPSFDRLAELMKYGDKIGREQIKKQYGETAEKNLVWETRVVYGPDRQPVDVLLVPTAIGVGDMGGISVARLAVMNEKEARDKRVGPKPGMEPVTSSGAAFAKTQGWDTDLGKLGKAVRDKELEKAFKPAGGVAGSDSARLAKQAEADKLFQEQMAQRAKTFQEYNLSAAPTLSIPSTTVPYVQSAVKTGNITKAAIMAHEGYIASKPEKSGGVEGLSVGFGIDMRGREKNLSSVKKMLNAVGQPATDENAMTLVKTGKLPDGSAVNIEQASLMLDAILPDYERDAKGVFLRNPVFGGDKAKAEAAWDDLAPQHKAALVMLTYNAGPNNLVDSQHEVYNKLKANDPFGILKIKWTQNGGQPHPRPLQYAASVAADPMLLLTRGVGNNARRATGKPGPAVPPPPMKSPFPPMPGQIMGRNYEGKVQPVEFVEPPAAPQ